MILDFERPIKDFEERIAELRRIAGPSEELRVEISRLEEALDAARRRIYSNLSPYQRVQVARHPERPNFRAYRDALADDFYELSGDRLFGDDPAVRGGLARIGDHNVVLVGHDRQHPLASRCTGPGAEDLPDVVRRPEGLPARVVRGPVGIEHRMEVLVEVVGLERLRPLLPLGGQQPVEPAYDGQHLYPFRPEVPDHP